MIGESLVSVTSTLESHARSTRRIARLGPGILVAAIAATAALLTTRLTGVSSMLVAIILGALLANIGLIPEASDRGIAFVAKRILRVGVALLGLQLVVGDILGLGVGMVGVIIAVVVVGITATLLVGRWLGIGLTQRLLIACGFSICGAAAVAAADGVIDADESEAASAVGLVVLFGTLMIPAVPLAGRLLGLPDQEIGLWAGGSIHEVAQVVAAGGAIGSAALTVAVLVKLGRVLLLAPVLAVVSLWMRRRSVTGTASRASRPPIVPLFVASFLGLAALRSTGVVPAGVVDLVHGAQTVTLTMAMFALGCGVRLGALRRGGVRPLALASISTVVVATTALVGVILVSAN